MEPKIDKALRSLDQNNFSAVYAEDIKEARETMLGLIPKGSTIGIGDSVSIRQLQVFKALQTQGRILINPFSKEISLMTSKGEIGKKQRRKMHKLALTCEFFLTGTNAINQDGKLVNIDGAGNRVAGMIFGPEKVIIVVGRNKIVQDIDQAFYRIKNIIAPHHAKMKEYNTPCVQTEKCTDCKSKDRICNVSTIIEKKPSSTDLTVVIVNEDLGLGWDEDWPKERIDRIYSRYCKLTWLKKPPWRSA